MQESVARIGELDTMEHQLKAFLKPLYRIPWPWRVWRARIGKLYSAYPGPAVRDHWQVFSEMKLKGCEWSNCLDR
jgi:hypothetical protein